MMEPTLVLDNAKVFLGSCLDVLPTLPDNSVDAVVTDPPYELGFMGKSWDASGIAYNVKVWEECLRVLKPGGHLLAFGGSRTWHRLAVAIEDAGFEIRDNIAWLYGSGFPKSHNISKAIDKAAGAERQKQKVTGKVFTGSNNNIEGVSGEYEIANAEAITPEAQQWDGWGTALKPAHEPIVVARKPVVGTVAENVLQFGVGGLNIDASRIGTEVISVGNAPVGSFAGGEQDRGSDTKSYREHVGRWPANIILDETTAELLDEQSGNQVRGNAGSKQITNFTFGSTQEKQTLIQGTTDKGGASRFFYVAKASKRDRNEGLDELPEVRHADRNATDGVGGDNPRNRTNTPKQNFHPTVKPTSLMTYLIKLVTPANGVVLDPFTGSGSTGKAALLEGFQFVGVELTEEYLPIIAGRLQFVAEKVAQEKGDDLFADL
jgi:DNA modification methylase